MKIIKFLVSLMLMLSIIVISTNVRASFELLPYNINFDLTNTLVEMNKKTLFIDRLEPGSKGKIIINVSSLNKNYDYKIIFFNEENKPTNLYFIYQDTRYDSLEKLTEKIKGMSNNKNSYTIYYHWDYETGKNSNEIEVNDKIDTDDQGKIYSFDIKLVLEDNNKELLKIQEPTGKTTLTKLPKTGI